MNIFICGDSTAQTYDPAQTLMVGWGQLLGDFLPGVTVCNHAKAGRSTKSFLAEGRLQALDGQIKPGDLVLIQFAHNDENEKPERHTEPWTTYTDNLTAFIRFARERGAVPALLTPICMRVWENGALQETHGEYKDAMRSLAIKMDVPLLDIYRDSFRIVASAKVDKYLKEHAAEARSLKQGQEVDLLVWQKTALGFKVIINNRLPGLVYANQVFRSLHTGDRTKGYISNVREDGKIDVTLQPTGRQLTESFSSQLLDYLKAHDGFCPFGDKSNADDIKRQFEVSKKTFKKAIGELYKKRLITLEDNGIRLCTEHQGMADEGHY